jgi:hypothetical protein
MTAAQHAARALERAGIFASVTKAPQRANPRGCTYGVKLGARNLTDALRVLHDSDIPVGKVFSYAPDGAIAEVPQ